MALDINYYEFPWAIVYRTPYDDETVIALFATKRNAHRVCKIWQKDCQDDEIVEVRHVDEEVPI